MQFSIDTFAKTLVKFRQSKNMSQKELAKAANLSQALISMIESGKVETISMEHLSCLADGLGITIDLLLEDFIIAMHLQSESESTKTILEKAKLLDNPDLKSYLRIVEDYVQRKKAGD